MKRKKKKKPARPRRGVTSKEEKALPEPIPPSTPNPERPRGEGRTRKPRREAAPQPAAGRRGADSLGRARSPLAGRRRHPPGDRHGRRRRFGTPGELHAAPLGAPFPSRAAQAQAVRRRAAGGAACSGPHGPSGTGRPPELVPAAEGVPHTGGGGAALTRTTSNRVPPAPLSADADVGTPDLAWARRK